MKLRICYCTDETYIPYAAVSINSALQTKNPDTEYEFVIASRHLSNESKERLKDLCNPEFIDINKEDFENFRCGVHYISEAAAYRLYVPHFLKKGKLLYIDCDTLIQEDLTDLFKTDLKGNCIGAVLDCNYKTGRKRTGTVNYFNSGVIFFDCKKWYDNNYFEKVRAELNNPVNTLPDQDALNRVMAHDVLYLPLKYNAMRFQTPRKFDYVNEMLTEYNHALKNPVIKHYISKHKPWHVSYDEKEREIYLRYIEGTGFDKTYYYTDLHVNINQDKQVNSPVYDKLNEVSHIYIDDKGTLFNRDTMQRI